MIGGFDKQFDKLHYKLYYSGKEHLWELSINDTVSWSSRLTVWALPRKVMSYWKSIAPHWSLLASLKIYVTTLQYSQDSFLYYYFLKLLYFHSFLYFRIFFFFLLDSEAVQSKHGKGQYCAKVINVDLCICTHIPICSSVWMPDLHMVYIK